MDALNPDLIAALVAVAGVAGTGSLAYYAVRRAREARRRDIEGAGEPRRAIQKPKRRAFAAEDIDADLADDGATDEADERALDGAAPAPAAPPPPAAAAAARPSPPVPPFPAPAVTVEKPARPEAARPHRTDAAALAPGLARTRAG